MTIDRRRMTGSRNHHAGHSAEAIVEQHYMRSGRRVTDRRWRCASGELDLIAREGDKVIFVEVKAARDFDRAAERLSRHQIERLYAAGAEFLAQMPRGQDTDVRFDVALVDGMGRVQVLENALMM